METTAKEKIAMLGAKEVATPAEADLILFLSAPGTLSAYLNWGCGFVSCLLHCPWQRGRE